MLNAYIETCTKVHFSSDRRTIIAHKSRTVAYPNLVSKLYTHKVMKEKREILSGYRR